MKRVCAGTLGVTSQRCRACANTITKDARGDTCRYYQSYPQDCGSHDTTTFHAARDCCACGGGHVPSSAKVCFLKAGESTNGNWGGTSRTGIGVYFTEHLGVDVAMLREIDVDRACHNMIGMMNSHTSLCGKQFTLYHYRGLLGRST